MKAAVFAPRSWYGACFERGMKHLLVLSAPVTFFLGFLLGKAAPPEPTARKVEESSPPAVNAPAVVPESPVIERQRQEIDRLKAEVAALKATPAAPKAPDRSVLAAEMFELFLRSKRREAAPEDKLEMIKRIGQLEPSMAAFFIEKYRTATDPEIRETAFVLTMLSGGPDASLFAAELLRDTSVDAPTRRQLMRSLAGLDDMPARCTAEESLTRIGVDWARSSRGDERAAAAGILGMGGSAEGVVLLRGLAETDASENVRAAAVVGLAKIGDADVLAYLKAMETRADLSDYLKRYLKTAIGSLERRLSK